MGKLKGKIAVITGGSSGIGFATAKRFIDEGAEVVITGRRQAELDVAVKELGPHTIGVRGDVANLADLDRLYEVVKQKKGRIDVLFANAGGAEFAKLDAVTEEHFDKIFDANVKGLLFTVQKALPLLTDGSSVILNASIVASTGTEAFSVYSASKAAVRSFARSWTSDLKSRKIRVNAVSPGPIDTEGLALVAAGNAEEFKRTLVQAVPLGRIGRPDEVAKAVTFLASDDSSFVTGIELFVDGGMAQI